MIKVYETIDEIPWLRIRFKDDSKIGLIVESNDDNKIGTEYRSEVYPSESKHLKEIIELPICKEHKFMEGLAVAFYGDTSGEVIHEPCVGIFKLGKFSRSWLEYKHDFWIDYIEKKDEKYPKYFSLKNCHCIIKQFDDDYNVIIDIDDVRRIGEEAHANTKLNHWIELHDYVEKVPFEDNRKIQNNNEKIVSDNSTIDMKVVEEYGLLQNEKIGMKFDTKSIQGDRQPDYGDVDESHKAIASMWNTYINRKPECNVNLSHLDVAVLMVLFKACREGYKHKFDNILDMASYADIALGFCNDEKA